MTSDAAWTAAITTAAANALRDIPGTAGMAAVIASEATRNAQKETDHEGGRPEMTDTTTIQTMELLWIGDDGEWLVAVGHHDLAEFAAAADKKYRDTTGEPDSLSEDFTPQHCYWRPVTREDRAAAYARLGPHRLRQHIDTILAAWETEGYMHFVNEPGPDTEPITAIYTGLLT